MPSDSNTAMQFFHLMLKVFKELRETTKDIVDIVGGIFKETKNEAKEIMNNRKEAKMEKEANKGGEIAIDKLQKNHKEISSAVIQPENLDAFKKFSKEFNLQYSTSREDDGKVRIHYSTDQQDRFNTTVDSLARSINFKQQNEVKDDNVINPKELNDKELISATKTVNNLDDLIKSATDRADKHNKENKLELGMHSKKLSMER